MLIAPLFLLGLLGLALPWWLHRLEMQTTEREKFATTRFLEPSRKRIHVQRKLRYLLLMALRMAFLALLAIAFARPILLEDPDALAAGSDSLHHVIVVDTSFSMREGGRMAAARDRVAALLDAMGSDDSVSLYSASTGVATLVEPTTAADDGRELLGTLAADNGRLDFGAMVAALDPLLEQSPAPVSLHLVSDLQLTGQAIRFADMIPDVVNGLPVTLDLQPVVDGAVRNASVESVVVDSRDRVLVSVRVSNGSLAAGEREATLSVNGVAQLTQPVPADVNGVAQLVFEGAAFADGDNRVDVALQPTDTLADDDVRYTVFDNSPPAPVLLLTTDLGSLGVTYLSAALATAPRGYAAEPTLIDDVDARILQRYPWVIIDDLGAVDGALAGALTDYVTGGGAVFAALGPQSAGQSALPLLGLAASASVLGNDAAPVPIAQIDISHPALRDGSGWANVNVHPLKVTPAAEDRLLITQEGQIPVLLERSLGAGRVLLFTAALDNSSADLPVKPVFVSFMAEAAQYLSDEKLLVRAQTADSYLQLNQSGGASGQVIDPNGQSLLSLQATTEAQEVRLQLTGYYQVFTPAGEVLVAVNPDQRESDLGLMSADTLANWQSGIRSAAGTAAVATDMALAEQRRDDAEEIELWRAFLLLMALFLLAESLLSARYLNLKTGTF
ncbi:MAG: BatA domain-containing protein [Pseudohongiellaceae bacterium]